MSDTPRTETAIDAPMAGPDGLDIVIRLTALCATFEGEYAALREELRQTRENLFHDLDRDRDDITTPHLAVVAGNAIAGLRAANASLQKELESLRFDFQAACPHDEWEKIDGRYDTDRGVGGSCYQQCPVCGKIKEWDDEGPDSDDGDPDVERERREDEP